MILNQITVPSLHLERSVSFYKKLGLHLIVESIPHYARFEFLQGDATFSVHLVDKLPTGAGICVYFEFEDLDAYVKELLKKGFEFSELPNDKDWLWREARLKDPDGNSTDLV